VVLEVHQELEGEVQPMLAEVVVQEAILLAHTQYL
jgi:hypothetical protein